MSTVTDEAAQTTLEPTGIACPLPTLTTERVLLGHGSGGKLSAALFRERILPKFVNPILAQQGDAAICSFPGVSLAMSTDTFVVHPLEFPGGNIGTLAVNGTVNDLAMMGARPCYITAAFVLEEGLPFDVLDRVIDSMARAAHAAGVSIVGGDTKVVDRGKGDGLFINTTGVGLVDSEFNPTPDGARPGDVVLVSGPVGRHGIAIMAVREGLEFGTEITSDTVCLVPLVDLLRSATAGDVSALRDPTRGGVASTLNEIAAASRVGIVIEENAVPVPTQVRGACEMLGLDPLYVANEGVLVAFVPAACAVAALAALRSHPLGANAQRIGRVVETHPGLVVMRTVVGGTRVVDMLPGDQLPRIC